MPLTAEESPAYDILHAELARILKEIGDHNNGGQGAAPTIYSATVEAIRVLDRLKQIASFGAELH